MQFPMRMAILLAVAILQPLFCLSEAHAVEPGAWYLGFRPMLTRLSLDSGQFKRAALGWGSDTVTEMVDTGKSGVEFHGGFRLTPFLAVEAGYAYLGNFDFYVPGPHPCAGAPPDAVCPAIVIPGSQGHLTVDGWSLSGVGVLPLGERLELNGRLGLILSTVKLEDVASYGDSSLDNMVENSERKVTERRISPLVGVELRCRLTPELSASLGAEWMHGLGRAETTSKVDVDAVFFGLQYNFP